MNQNGLILFQILILQNFTKHDSKFHKTRFKKRRKTNVRTCVTRLDYPFYLYIMEDFLDVEDRDGIRFTWNLWPSSTKEAQSLGIPIACMYTPAKENVVTTHLDPSFCSKCKATLNPYWYVYSQLWDCYSLRSQYNVDTQTWSCPFCYTVNKFNWSIDEGMKL